MFITSGYALKKIPSARNLPQRAEFKSFPMQIGKWQGKRSYIDKKILAELWADDYVQATYFKPNSRNAIHVLIPFFEYQTTRHTAHAPQACLLGGGWALTESKERTIKMDDGRRMRDDGRWRKDDGRWRKDEGRKENNQDQDGERLGSLSQSLR